MMIEFRGVLRAGLLGLVLITVTLQVTAAPVEALSSREAYKLMPWPADVRSGKGRLELPLQMGVQIYADDASRIAKALERWRRQYAPLVHLDPSACGALPSITIRQLSPTATYPSLETDESYQLRVDRQGIELTANSYTGIIWGLASLAQLGVDADKGGVSLPIVEVVDKPRYPWRGLLLDVVRHWMPLPVVKRTIDAMSAVKMNVLHLHLTDDQGFRIESKTYPRLHQEASGGHYYTQEEMGDLIRYAADRGIRIVPEFDVPAHASSWLTAYPELGSAPGPYQLQTTWGVFRPTLDPTREEVYEFLDAFFAEMAAVFPDKYLHIGGDEVRPDDWQENAAIQDFMRERGLADARALQTYFNQRLGDILDTHGKIVVGWNEILHPDLPKSVLIQPWYNARDLYGGVQQGYRAIRSYGYYLDYLLAAGIHYGIDPESGPPDTSAMEDREWQYWEFHYHFGSRVRDGSLLLFGKPGNLRGRVTMDEKQMYFHQAALEQNQLKIRDMSTFPLRMDYDLSFDGEVITGVARRPGYEGTIIGERIGGSSIAGTVLPEVKRFPPLTEEERSRIMGVEACMWTEFVTEETLDSRVWPRTGAIAEKAWSPKSDTQADESGLRDMYRRLDALSAQLTSLGLTHESYREPMLKQLSGRGNVSAWQLLVETLEPVKYHSGQKYLRDTDVNTVFRRIADVSPPESRQARVLARRVDQRLQNKLSAEDLQALKAQLRLWRDNHQKLQPQLAGVADAEAIEQLSLLLSRMADAALDSVSGQSIPCEDLTTLWRAARKPYAAVQLAVTPALQKLVGVSCTP